MTGPAIRSVTLAVLLLSAVSGAAAQDARSAFEEGNRLYREGEFAVAVDRYEAIRASGYESGPLLYNLGNAYFKVGDLGRATLNYERALRLMPRDEDTRANLALARSLAADEITPLPGFWLFRVFDWWVHLLSGSALTAIVGLAYLATTGGLVVRIWSRAALGRRWGSRVAVIGGVVTLVFGINLAVVEWEMAQPDEGIVLVEEIPVHSAPSDDPSLQLFTIHEAAKVRIDDRNGEWVEIVLADGKVGWIPAAALEVI